MWTACVGHDPARFARPATPAFAQVTRRRRAKARSAMPKLTRIYTRTGDDGTTGLVGGQRIKKNAARIEAYGPWTNSRA